MKFHLNRSIELQIVKTFSVRISNKAIPKLVGMAFKIDVAPAASPVISLRENANSCRDYDVFSVGFRKMVTSQQWLYLSITNDGFGQKKGEKNEKYGR